MKTRSEHNSLAREQRLTPLLFKLFGAVYLAANLIFLATTSSLIIATGTPVDFSSWPFLIVPAMGVAAGFWVYTRRFGRIKIILIVVSVVLSIALIFGVFISKGGDALMGQEGETQGPAHIDISTDQLFAGIRTDNIELVRKELLKGVDINGANDSQQTALHVTQDFEIAVLLIDQGADIHALDDMLMTPIFNKDVLIAQLLLDAGADINAVSKKGNTLFIWYAYSGYLEGLKWLVFNRADTNRCNQDGQNALDIANLFHSGSDLQKYLQDQGLTQCL